MNVENGMSIINWVFGDATFENINCYGTVTGTGNNQCARYVKGLQGTNQTVEFKNCDNYANIIGSGFVAAYVGHVNYAQGDAKVFLSDCDNYGKLLSTGPGASMILSNPTNSATATTGAISVKFYVENCINHGTITSTSLNTNLLLSHGGDGQPYTPATYQKFYINDQMINDVNSNLSKKQSIIQSATAGKLTGNNVSTVTVTDLLTENDKFVLPATANASRYELQFSFTAKGSAFMGSNNGYTMKFDETLPTDIKVGNWISKSEVVGTVETHNEYGTTYYTCGDSYVFYVDNGYISSKVFVTFIAYGAENEVLSISTYTYA